MRVCYFQFFSFIPLTVEQEEGTVESVGPSVKALRSPFFPFDLTWCVE